MSNTLVSKCSLILFYLGSGSCMWQVKAEVSRPQVLIRAAHQSADRFAAFVAVNRQWESLVRHLNWKLPQEANGEKIRNLLVRAQSEYFKGSGGARQLFETLVQESFADDWGRSERAAFFYSSLRLAEMNSLQKNRDHWLDLALKFSSGGRKAGEWTQKILARMSLKLQRHFEKRKKAQEVKIFFWRPWRQFESVEYIIVNGERFANAPNLEIPLYPGPQRLTLLSNSSIPWTGRVTSEEIALLQVPIRSIVGGTCERPRFSEPVSGLSEFGAWFDKDCILMSKDLPLPETFTEVGNDSTGLPLAPIESTSTTGMKRWIPIALGVVIGAITLNHFYQQSQPHRKIIIEE